MDALNPMQGMCSLRNVDARELMPMSHAHLLNLGNKCLLRLQAACLYTQLCGLKGMEYKTVRDHRALIF